MKKYLTKLKSNKGVTLTELLIGMGMFALFLSAISLLFSGLNRSRDTIIELAELNTLLDNVSAPIIRDITNATSPLFGGCVCVCSASACDPNDPDCGFTLSCSCTCHTTTCTCVISTGIDEISIPLGGGGVFIVYTIDPVEGILMQRCRSVECNEPCDEAACDPADPECGTAALPCACVCHDHDHAVLQKAFYKGKSVSFTVAPVPAASGVTYTLTVIVYRDVDGVPSPTFDNEVISREYAIRPLGLNQFNN
jgi:hypothetical protein